MKLQTKGRRWIVLNYVVSEPGEWTCRGITEDLGENFHGITEAMIFLSTKGLVKKGKKSGRSHVLLPTPSGITVHEQSM